MAVDSMRHLMAIVDDRYQIRSINQALAEKLGLTAGQTLLSPCFENLHSTGEPPRCCPLQREKYNGGKHLQERSESLFGGQYLVSVSPLKDRLGTVTGCIYVARSQTECERHRLERDERRESMRALMQKAEQLIFVQDAEARYLFFTATPGPGDAPVDVIGRSPEDLFEPAAALRMVDRVRQVAREGKEFMELTSINVGEQVLLFVDQLAPLRDAGGSITAVATLSKRMTERNYGGEELSSSSKASRELTQRETGILRLIASGLTSAQIGERLGISRKTVETHRTRIMQKLDIHKTSALVRYAAKAGLL
jgi:DNA-binding CsgD family transcriptional regulator